MGPYFTRKDGSIGYCGNNIFPQIENISGCLFSEEEMKNRVYELSYNVTFPKLSKINHRINIAVNSYFDNLGALFTLLPLTTRMISSPGAVYGREAINYTTDTCPIKINWFDLDKTAFLSESSQIYLELTLIEKGINQVYSIYNSFRKEFADITHLSEFHHIEYEGKVTQKENVQVAIGLLKKIIDDLLRFNNDDLLYFIDENTLNNLTEITTKINQITFKEALNALYLETKNDKYKEFTMNETFSAWEEIKLTEIFNSMLIVSEFPLLEVPFYHSVIKNSEPKVANNADFIWQGYREILGSGERIGNKKELEEKSVIFNLPQSDYLPYIQSREMPDFITTSGFGLGWERLLQGLLKMPTIWSVSHFPRGHNTLIP